MKWIKATDIRQWATRRNSQESLPLLVRRLVRATPARLSRASFPAGDSIQKHGWDGILESSDSTEFIPQGLSLWEFSVRGDIETAAEENYQKRTSKPLGYTPSNSTFVFATARAWEKKDIWRAKKLSEGKWKDIRVLDADDLEQWIESCPAIGAWFSKSIGKLPERGILSMEDFWEEWSKSEERSLTPSVVTAGRAAQAEDLVKQLTEQPKVLCVQAQSREEAIAFIVSSAMQSNDKFYEEFQSRCLIISDSETFRTVSASQDSLFLIPKFEDSGVVNRASGKGHFVLLPLGGDHSNLPAGTIRLPQLAREPFVKALQDSGFGERDAQRYSKESGRSISILRRQLGFERSLPDWAKGESAREVIPALLLGRWDEQKAGDQQILSSLAGEPYGQYVARLSKWLKVQDPPVFRIGNQWRLASPLDAWLNLGAFVTAPDFEQLKSAILQVVGEVNPSLELEPEKRWMASAYGKVSQYSEWSREGLVQSLILIGLFDNRIQLQTSLAPQSWVDGVVTDLLKDADGKKWISLEKVLPAIAEASPTTFLESVQNSLSKSSKPIMEMFVEDPGMLGAWSYQSGLLWALEGIAWMADYLGRVTMILAELSSLDPGGRLANRPSGSLRSIFLPWFPQTEASGQDRIQVLATLSKQKPSVAWTLLLTLLPRYHDVGNPTHKMRWRYVAAEQTEVTYPEIWKNHSTIVDLLLSQSPTDEGRISQLVEHIASLSPQDRAKILEYVDSLATTLIEHEYLVWHGLRELLHHHRSYPEARWALPESELMRIEDLFNRLTPSDVIQANIWIFDEHWPKFPEGRLGDARDYRKNEELILERRKNAVKSILGEVRLDGLLRLAGTVKEPSILGDTTAFWVQDKPEALRILELFRSENKQEVRFAESYVRRLQRLLDMNAIKALFQEIVESRFPAAALSHFLVSLPQSIDTWVIVDSCGSEVSQLYWKECSPLFHPLTPESKAFGLEKLLGVGRHFSALDTAALTPEELPTDLIVKILEKTATVEASEPVRFQSYDVGQLFKQLDKRDDLDRSKLLRLEWLYISVLASPGVDRVSLNLHQELSRSPEFFVDLLKWIYPIDDEKDEPKDIGVEFLKNRAQSAYQLLSSLNTVPGVDERNQIDSAALSAWVSKVRTLASACSRSEIGDHQIGQLLAKSPTEGVAWPQDAVCKVLDISNSESMNDGFCMEIRNSRGTVSKSLIEGGTQERELASRFRGLASRLSTRWPITSSLLEKVAQSYDAEARSEDDEARQTDLDY